LTLREFPNETSSKRNVSPAKRNTTNEETDTMND